MIALGEAMTEGERAAEAAIRAVPGWAQASIVYRRAASPLMSPMHKTVDSDCYAVDVDGAAYFLKIIDGEMRAAIDVASSFDAACQAAETGVAPTPRHCLPHAHALVFDRLDDPWRTATTDDLRRPAVMAATLAAKRRIQSSRPFGRAWSVFDAIRALPAPTDDIPDLWWMRDAVGDIEAAIAAAGSETAPCHADGLACNIMVEPGDEVMLVDFDAACDTDPLYDVAILLNEAYAFEEEMLPALEMYEGTVRQATLARCHLYAITDDLYWGLWASRMDATSTRRGIEFLKYANWRYLRCRLALRNPEFERWLRTL